MKTFNAFIIVISLILLGILYHTWRDEPLAHMICETDEQCEKLPMVYSLPSRWLDLSR